MAKFKCVVACTNANGSPDFFPCVIECTRAQYDNGFHYDAAKDAASEAGYENLTQAVVFDENDGPLWLFANFAWADVKHYTCE
jgi:uncharacterized protein YneR